MSAGYANVQRYKRENISTEFKVYTSAVPGKYTVELANISRKGAFIKNPHYPKIGETISYMLVDTYDREVFMGNARVVWHKENCSKRERGYGIELENELSADFLDRIKRI
ncbi:MAG: PilZ domain-containing protein [Oligoflexales bacterium]|nr:PilZ domain-containing protein [Oligoflexales bacterium]